VTAETHYGTVIAGFGRDTMVQADDGSVLRCTARSRHTAPVCGDRVEVLREQGDRGVIRAIAPRETEFARASIARTKVIAANVTQVVILVACEPSFSDELVCRLLVAAEHVRLPAVLVLNKVDLLEQLDRARRSLDPFREIGYPIVELSGKLDAGPLRPLLLGHRSLLVGQSGMGKSSLVKSLVPDAEVRIGAISRFLDSGRQSTTASRLYAFDRNSELVDSPGIAEFGLAGLSARDVAARFREFGPYAGACRFHDCRHLAEPGCAVEAAVERNAIHARRLELYRRIVRADASRRD
jgi:ribosome biogenesis GTPase